AQRSALAWYRAAGVEPRLTNEPADHIGLLLAFFAHMLATENDPDVVRAFADEHLAWVPAFCDRVSHETRHTFYRQLSNMTHAEA
ncbi:MAG: molecular chaperone TorD family protein, partial [Acidobacteria bacterium]|nr:molecular chaperone TorD family protein [Acidobacteriota bacterium]